MRMRPTDRATAAAEMHRNVAWASPVTLRLASDGDRAALRDLAGLDSRRLPPGPHLVAERDGRIEAALSLSTRELVADPFRRTVELCELLRCHAGQAPAAQARARAARLRPRPRVVPA
jgi:hypothetical protein